MLDDNEDSNISRDLDAPLTKQKSTEMFDSFLKSFHGKLMDDIKSGHNSLYMGSTADSFIKAMFFKIEYPDVDRINREMLSNSQEMVGLLRALVANSSSSGNSVSASLTCPSCKHIQKSQQHMSLDGNEKKYCVCESCGWYITYSVNFNVQQE